MANDIRFKRLEKAKFSGLSRDYATAYGILDALLAQNPTDVEALRLYANIHEMDGLGEQNRLVANRKMKLARIHHRHILEIDPSNLYALFDLADQMVHFGRVRCATLLYEAFLANHTKMNPVGYEDEVAEAEEWLAGFRHPVN